MTDRLENDPKQHLTEADRLRQRGCLAALSRGRVRRAPVTGQDGSVRYPDFTIEDAETGRRVFLEHLGLLSEPAYLRRWLAKLDWYRSQGVLPEDEGEGDAGTLLTTTEENGIDSLAIENRLRTLLGL